LQSDIKALEIAIMAATLALRAAAIALSCFSFGIAAAVTAAIAEVTHAFLNSQLVAKQGRLKTVTQKKAQQEGRRDFAIAKKSEYQRDQALEETNQSKKKKEKGG